MKKNLVCPIRPLGKYLFVKRLEAIKKTEAGLFVPDSAQEKPQYGRVLAIGPETDVKEGDIVVFGKYAGADVDVLDKEPLVMLEKDEVVGVVVSDSLIKELTGN